MWPRWKIVVLADADRGNDGRAKKLTKKRRSEIAKKAARARWGKG